MKSLSAKTTILSSAVIVAIYTSATQPAIWGGTLDITVATNRKQYTPDGAVCVKGNLTWVPHMIPVADGLMRIEIRQPT